MQHHFFLKPVGATLSVVALVLFFWSMDHRHATGNERFAGRETGAYIVQADTAGIAAEAVRVAGGQVLGELKVIRAVGAELTPDQVSALRSGDSVVAVYEDRGVKVSQVVPDTHFPGLIGAAELHAAGVVGSDVTVAVLDTGLWDTDGTEETPSDADRIIAQYDVILDGQAAGSESTIEVADYDPALLDDDDDDAVDDDENASNGSLAYAGSIVNIEDWSGHGTHVTSIIVGSRKTDANRFQGVAPGANVVAVKAFEPDGSGRYIDVIRGIDWIVANKDKYAIRVLNLSFSGNAVSRYWEDPLNQAVMAAWQAGIVVVAAAGNSGPNPMTVGVPGNVPYVITVGAMTDNYTPTDSTDDVLATWSSTGPTHEGFIKPDLVAPGGHMLGIIPHNSWIALEYPQYFNPEGDYFTMSGTSQAAAVVSGVVALMLQADPSLSPDDVKCRLMATARPAVGGSGSMAYSIFQQGAGLVDALAVLASGASACANRGMDINLDLAGDAHYGGPAHEDENGTFYVVDPTAPDGQNHSDGYSWSGDVVQNDGQLWRRSLFSSDAGLWSRGEPWAEVYYWQHSSIETGGNLWRRSLDEPVSINSWVPQE